MTTILHKTIMLITKVKVVMLFVLPDRVLPSKCVKHFVGSTIQNLEANGLVTTGVSVVKEKVLGGRALHPLSISVENTSRGWFEGVFVSQGHVDVCRRR